MIERFKKLEIFVSHMAAVADLIREMDPDCILAPIPTALTVVDVLNVIDPTFPNHNVEYLPASMPPRSVGIQIRRAFENLIRAYTPQGGTILTIDRLSSPPKALSIARGYVAARDKYTSEKAAAVFGPDGDARGENREAFREQLKIGLVHRMIGIVDPKHANRKIKIIKAIRVLREAECVSFYEVPWPADKRKGGTYSIKFAGARNKAEQRSCPPKLEFITIGAAYLDFLKAIGEIVGRDTQSLTVMNLGKINDAARGVT